MIYRDCVYQDVSGFTYVKFGSKDVGIIPSIEVDGSVWVKFENVKKEEYYKTCDILMEFPNVESIDTVIKALQTAKENLTKNQIK